MIKKGVPKLPENLKDIILIAGATGLVAKSLKFAFEAIGCSVVSVSSSNTEGAITWDHLRRVGLPEKTSAVINTCGKNIFSPQPFNQVFVKQLYDSRVGTNLILREEILKAKNKPKTFITMSGVGLYETDPSIIHDEQSTKFNNDFWTDLIKKWEGATELPEDYSTRTIMIRSGVILSRNGGMIQNMYPQFYFGFGGTIGSGSQYMPNIHIRDLVRLIVFCAEIDTINGPVNAVTPNYCTMEEFTKAFAKTMRRPHFTRVPEFLIKNLLAKERSDILLGSVKVYPRKALEHGFEFLYHDIWSSMSGLNDLKY